MLARLWQRGRTSQRDNETTQISVYDWAKMYAPGSAVTYNGQNYQAFKTDGGGQAIGAQYYGSNPIVFACLATRMLLFSEMRFQFQQFRNGRPGDFFGTPELAVLEEPWVGHSTRDFLVQVELDVAATGNSYWTRTPENYLQRIDAAFVKILTSAAVDNPKTMHRIGEKLIGYAVTFPGQQDPTIYAPEDMVHHKPYPSMQNRFIGQSWLSPCLPDVAADGALTGHKQSTVDNGAQLGYVVSLDKGISKENFEYFVEKFRRDHEGPDNSGRTLFLGGGADVKTVGQSFNDMSISATQSAGETRIAACSGVPPTILGFAEGLKGSSLNAGNYGQARRRLVDGTMRPLWGFLASALQSVVKAPAGSRLWYDARDIAFLREDSLDESNILAADAVTVGNLIKDGFKPDACVAAVLAKDLARLQGQHTGLTSVQLQPPQTEPFASITPESDKQLVAPATPPPSSAPTNGNGASPAKTP